MTDDFSGRRLLIVGAGIFQTPAIIKAKEMGITVITVDKNPKSPGFKFADYSEIVSTHDKEGLLKVARKYKINGIMTLSTEVAVVPVAYVAEKLKLQGLTVDVARKATSKHLMREAFKKHDVPCPNFYLANNLKDLKKIENHLQFPLMVKPSDGYASKCVFKVNNSKELAKAFSMARDESTSHSVIIEEFIYGQEVGGESFTTNGLTKMIYITNKKVTKPPLYIPLGHSLPCKFSTETQDRIKDVGKKGIMTLGVQNGPGNFDIMVTKKGPVVLEMGARLGGNCLPIIVNIHSGIDTVCESIKLSLGGRPLLKEKFKKPVGVRLLTSKTTGKIVNITGIEELTQKEDVLGINFIHNVGDTVSKLSSGTDKVGYLIVVGRDVEDVEQKLDYYARKIKITTS